MRYRALDANGDYSFGRSAANFLVDSPACVAQAVLTKLRLWQGEWHLDSQEGTPWLTEVLGKYTSDLYDMAIQSRILDTQGVKSITAYTSVRDGATRKLNVSVTIDTIYGEATFSGVV